MPQRSHVMLCDTSRMVRTLDKVGVGLVYRIGSTSTYKKLFRYWYPLMTRGLSQHDDVVFLNWGYEEDPPLGLPLDESDEPNRYSIQLYHQTATQTDISGKKVLECSSGHGGGASYLTRTLKPASYTGLDFNAAGVEFCKERHNLPGVWTSSTATPRTCPFRTNPSTRWSTLRPHTSTHTSNAFSAR